MNERELSELAAKINTAHSNALAWSKAGIRELREAGMPNIATMFEWLADDTPDPRKELMDKDAYSALLEEETAAEFDALIERMTPVELQWLADTTTNTTEEGEEVLIRAW